MKDLSILIPARNEMFLAKTIEDILEHVRGNTEIIAVTDGYWPDPSLSQQKLVTVIHNPESIGQRAATNQAAKLSKAKYVMKVDAHCSFDEGFDVKMLESIAGHDDWTMVPMMRNLHAFDWVCPNGHRRYQGPSGPCKECGEETVRDIVWIAKESPRSVSYCFDSSPHFQYFGDYAKRPEGQGEITESMSLQGSCFMLTRDKYWELNVCDEDFGSWGSQGIEVAVKTWLSGGRVMVNKNTWYAHMFRTQGGDFGFPYPISGKQQEHAKTTARDLFFNNKWPLQKHPLSWLIEKFWPVPGWNEEDLQKLKANTFEFKFDEDKTKPAEAEPPSVPASQELRRGMPADLDSIKGPTKAIIYFTDSELDEKIAEPVRAQLASISQLKNIPIISTSLKPLQFGEKNLALLESKKGYVTMLKQILGALQATNAEIVFLCEHDILYHASHFDFVPKRKLAFYYNLNVWRVRFADGHALKVDNLKELGGLCTYRKNLIAHVKKRLERIEKTDDIVEYEPGTYSGAKSVDKRATRSWRSEFPNINIRHEGNHTKTLWNKDEYSDKKDTVGWEETTADKIAGWQWVLGKVEKPNLKKGIIFYTDNRLKLKIARAVQKQLVQISQDRHIPIVSASLKKMDFGGAKLPEGSKNIFFGSLKRGYEAMFKQIVGALEHSDADVIFFCEHDVLYHPSHFDFTPTDRNTFYYNQNVWMLRAEDGHALHYDVNQLSGMVGYREELLTHFKERLEMVEREGFSRKMGFEPMTHNRIKWEHMYNYDTWKSEYPNIDIKHENNLSGHRWKKEEFRNQNLLVNWQETDDEIPYWGDPKELAKKLL